MEDEGDVRVERVVNICRSDEGLLVGSIADRGACASFVDLR